MHFRLRYNAPVVLTLALAAIAVFALSVTVWPGLAGRYFSVGGSMNWVSPLDWFRLFSHVLGHDSWQHLTGNIGFILLLGPILEEKYGSLAMLFMVVVTALATGLVNVLFFSSALMGASGLLFMLIVLASIVDIRAREIPLTFLLVVVIFLGRELLFALRADDVSQMAHLVGGTLGAVLGFAAKRGHLPLGPVF